MSFFKYQKTLSRVSSLSIVAYLLLTINNQKGMAREFELDLVLENKDKQLLHRHTFGQIAGFVWVSNSSGQR